MLPQERKENSAQQSQTTSYCNLTLLREFLGPPCLTLLVLLCFSTQSPEDKVPVWYILDEFGSQVQHSDRPSCSMAPFYYVQGGLAYSVLWPLQNLQEGGESRHRQTRMEDMIGCTYKDKGETFSLQKQKKSQGELSVTDKGECKKSSYFYINTMYIKSLNGRLTKNKCVSRGVDQYYTHLSILKYAIRSSGFKAIYLVVVVTWPHLVFPPFCSFVLIPSSL